MRLLLDTHALLWLVEESAAETGLPRGTFPVECTWDLESLLADDEDAEAVEPLP
ncbi:MAG TPA: hypothetical protein VGG61_01650 [Gemmataceae bacterium]|jgi:PIN domain nuclease of toxin-antitoxin system